MVIFGIETEDEIDSYISKTNERLVENLLVHGEAKALEEKNTYAIDVSIRFPKIHYFGFMLLFGGLYLTHLTWKWYLWIPIVLSSLCFFYTKTYNYMVFRIGLRKHGYDGKVRLLKDQEFIKRLLHE